MSKPSENAATMPLVVRTVDSQSEILLLDSRGRLVARGFGPAHTFTIEPGIYRVKVLTGAETSEKTIVANEPPLRDVVFAATPFASPMPITGTTTSHEYHQAAVVQQCGRTHVTDGAGSSLMFFIRDFTPSSRQGRPSRVTDNPARDLSLHRVDAAGDRTICDLADAGEHDLTGDPWAACTIAVAPGVYELRLTLPQGDVLHQSFVATPGWQTQAFMFVRGYRERGSDAPPAVWRADLAKTSVVISGDNTFRPDDSLLRLDELARVALAAKGPLDAVPSGRRLVPEEVRLMLAQKRYNPILGIYGAHLLLLEPDPDMSLVREVVMNLRALLGLEHPDVAALAIRADPNTAVQPFEQPPMLRRSWMIINDASIGRPSLVSDALEARETADFVREGTWYIWRSAEEGDATALSALEEAVAEDLGVMKQVRQRKYAPRAIDTRDPDLWSARAPQPPAAGSAPADIPPVDERQIRSMVRRYGVSASKVARAIESLRTKKF